MKTLVLDLGNTTLYVGEFQGSKLVRQFRVPAAAVVTAAAFAHEVAHRLSRDIHQVVLVSVVPARTTRLVGYLRKTLQLEPLVLNSQSNHGLKLAYRNPPSWARIAWPRPWAHGNFTPTKISSWWIAARPRP
jgi:pantothenate kinase type III